MSSEPVKLIIQKPIGSIDSPLRCEYIHWYMNLSEKTSCPTIPYMKSHIGISGSTNRCSIVRSQWKISSHAPSTIGVRKNSHRSVKCICCHDPFAWRFHT